MSLFTEFLGELKEFPNIRNYQAIIVNLVSCDDYVVRQEKKKVLVVRNTYLSIYRGMP